MKKENRGGKRPGAGRPKKDPTVTISYRIPEKFEQEIKSKIEIILQDYKNQ